MNQLKHSQDTNASVAMTTVDGWNIATIDDEPRVRDVDLAERLGFKEPRAIRKIIKRHLACGDLSHDDVRDAVSRTRIGVAERDVTEYWLSEAAALFVVTKSETENAIVLTKEMIRVFMLARRNALPNQNAILAAKVDALQEIVVNLIVANEKVHSELVTLRNEQAEARLSMGVLGVDLANQYLMRLRLVADCWVKQGRAKNRRSALAAIRQQLIAVLGFGGTGARMALFPIARRGELEVALASLERDVLRIEATKQLSVAKPTQGVLNFTVN